MKNKAYILSYLLLTGMFSACLEERLEPAEADVFIKMYDDNYQATAVDALLHPNGGVIMLANVSEANIYHPKLVKVDNNGNLEWETILPTGNVEAQSFIITSAGSYLLACRHINEAGISSLVVYETNNSGELLKQYYKAIPNTNITARAIVEMENGNVFVVGKVGNNTIAQSYLAELNKADFSLRWERTLSDEKLSIANKAYLNSRGQVNWGGGSIHQQSGEKVGQVYQIKPFEVLGETTEEPKTNGGTNFDFHTFLMTNTDQYAMLGSEVNGEETDLRLVLTSTSALKHDIHFNDGFSGGDTPASITRAIDGGYLILGTSEGGAGLTDFLLIKTDEQGREKFEHKYFGGFNAETAATVLQAPDGGIIMYGHTRFATVNTLLLIKTDINGEL